MELKNGISTFCPHCDESFTMYPFGQEVIDSAELDALRQRIEADEVNYKLMAEERRQALASLANAANEAEALRARVAFLTNELIGTRGALESLHDDVHYNLQYQVQQMIDMINEALEAE